MPTSTRTPTAKSPPTLASIFRPDQLRSNPPFRLLRLHFPPVQSPETQITDAEELALARLQLEEWERMMSMLQADRDSAQDHLAKLQLVETTNRGEIGEVCVDNTLRNLYISALLLLFSLQEILITKTHTSYIY